MPFSGIEYNKIQHVNPARPGAQFDLNWSLKKSTEEERENFRRAQESAEQKASQYANRRFIEWKAGEAN